MRQTLLVLLTLAACGGGTGFQSAADFAENATIKKAIADSHFVSYPGSSPPTITGKYTTNGQVAASADGSLVGRSVISTTCLYNQKAAGQIDYAEKANNLVAGGQGFFISGSGNNFTVWEELRASSQTCSQHNALLMTGTKSGANIEASGLLVVLDSTGCSIPDGYWYATNTTWSSTGSCSGASDL